MLSYNSVKRMVEALVQAGIDEKFQKCEFDVDLVKYHELLKTVKDLK